VKGAASAAARARWAKYRSEKLDDSDDGERRTKRGSNANMARKDRGAAADKPVEGTVVEIKGKEYVVGDDELIMDDDVKGDTKVDSDGNLLGGALCPACRAYVRRAHEADREYRLVTFMSDSRKNPKKVYALTVDAARACGYQDSLAFLRRFPQILKLACDAGERQMLIDIGRVTGNLKNRMVTMVSMRSVFKVMGARVVKSELSRGLKTGQQLRVQTVNGYQTTTTRTRPWPSASRTG
jgi:chromatin structure-remodeling complex protein RSC7